MLLFLSTLLALTANASVRLESGLTAPITEPQSEIYDIGASQSIKLQIPITPALDFGPAVSLTALPKHKDKSEYGMAWGAGVGMRLKAPRTESANVSPWLDSDLLYTRTGELSRVGFDLGTGLAFSTSKNKSVWFGPYARYGQVIQPNTDKQHWDNRDAKLVSVGLNLEIGKGIVKKPDCPEHVIQVAPSEPCFDEPCSMDHVTLSPKPEVINETVHFAHDETKITSADEVKLQAVIGKVRNTDYVIVLQGHTDNTGSDKYNQELSEKRADVVATYLIHCGVESSRIEKQGYSENAPVGDNDTLKGRASNRRTEIVIYISTGSN